MSKEKQMSKEDFLHIDECKKHLKNDETYIDICKEYDVDKNFIDFVPVCFKNIDVSAQTNHGIIFINNLLKDNSLDEICGYLLHEFIHFLQQLNEPTIIQEDENYLDNKFELESFQNQVKYINDNEGEDKADEYVEDLVDYHDIPKKQVEKKKKELSKKL